MVIGDVKNGFYYDKTYGIKKGYTEMRNEICKNCWAIRFCSSCYLGAISNGSLCKREKEKECKRIRAFWGLYMKRYIEIMEENPHAFDYLRKWVKKEQYFLL